MRVSHSRRARPDALGANDEPRGCPAGELDNLVFGTDGNRLQAQQHRHHVDAPHRRPKTLEELHAGAEFVEIADRRAPGRLAKEGWR